MYKLCMQKWLRSYFNNLTPKQRRNVRQRMRETENKRDKNQCNRESEQCIVFCSVLCCHCISLYLPKALSMCLWLRVFVCAYVNVNCSTASFLYKYKSILNKWATTTKSFRSYSICFLGVSLTDRKRERERNEICCTRFEATIAYVYYNFEFICCRKRRNGFVHIAYIDDGN